MAEHMDDFPGRVGIEIFSDPICPWCFIGKRRLEAALAHCAPVRAEIAWLPFQLNPDMPREGMPRERYLEWKFGGADAARRVYEPIEAAGRACGIEFRFDLIERTPSTLDAHRLIALAADDRERQNALVETLFRAYFLRGEDIGDRAVLAACAAEAGLDPLAVERRLASDEGVEVVSAEAEQAHRMGIRGVPLFIVARRFAVSGAQPPEVFREALQVLERERAEQPSAASR